MISGHGRLYDVSLQRPPSLSHRLGPEVVKAEPARQFPADVVSFPAPVAVGIATGVIPQPANQPAGSRKLMTHPGRHHRAAPSHRQPRQRVGKFPALLCRIRHSRPGLGEAGVVRQAPVNGVLSLGGGWPMRTSQRREKPVEPRAVLRGCEPVPRREQLGSRIAESLLLVVEHLQRKPGVQFGIIQTAPYQ